MSPSTSSALIANDCAQGCSDIATAFPARVLVYRHIPACQEPMSLGRLRQNSDAAKKKHGRGRALFTSHKLSVLGHYLILYWTSIGQRLLVQGLRQSTHPVS